MRVVRVGERGGWWWVIRVGEGKRESGSGRGEREGCGGEVRWREVRERGRGGSLEAGQTLCGAKQELPLPGILFAERLEHRERGRVLALPDQRLRMPVVVHGLPAPRRKGGGGGGGDEGRMVVG